MPLPTLQRESRYPRWRRRRLLVLDRELLRVRAERGGIEAADVLSEDGALVHVKRKGKSSVLSHLLFQAGNSADLLRRSREARDQLRALIEASACPAILRDRLLETTVEPVENEVVFALLGDWRGRDASCLPLFSKIRLVHAGRRLRQLGYRPAIALVSPAVDDGQQAA